MRIDRPSIAIALLLSAALAVAGQPASIVPASGSSRISASGAGGSFLPIFSQEGGTIVYLSYANNLVTNDTSNLSLDVFASPPFGGTTELISVGTNRPGGANADCFDVAVPRYGLNIAFTSRASNLTTNETNNAVDVFVRYRGGATVPSMRLISADLSGRSPVDPIPFATRPLSTSPQFANFLDRVVFASAATNLVAGLLDTNDTYDVFVRDLSGVSGALRLVSTATTPDITPSGSSYSPQISDSGQYVAFISTATNIVDGSTNRGGDIYLRNLNSAGATPIWLSRLTCQWLVGGFPAPPCAIGATYYCFNYALSGNGLSVAYQANAGPGTSNVLLYGQSGANAIRIATDSDLIGRPQISSQGDLVAFSSRSNIYLWDRATGSNTLISVSTNGGPANGPSHSPVMGSNARMIAFVSKATDLGPEGTSNRYQIYVYDRLAGTTHLASVNTNGTVSAGDFELSNLAVPSDGFSTVAFDSTASDLVPNDLNGESDVFVRDLSANVTRLISRANASLPSHTTPMMSGTSPASISADGRIIAFSSYDSPFVADDTNSLQDVFVRNLASGALTRLSGQTVGPYLPQAAGEAVSATGSHVVYTLQSAPYGGRSLFWYNLASGSNVLVATTDPIFYPSRDIFTSSNGNLVVFQSTTWAYNLDTNVFEANGNGLDIFARDMTTGQVKLLSANYVGDRTGNGPSFNPVLSPDARWVVFQSSASDLRSSPSGGGGGVAEGDAPGGLYARDLQSNTNRLVYPNVLGGAAFSGNSEWVAFATTNSEIHIRNLFTNIRRGVCTNCGTPAPDGTGRFVAYETIANLPKQIYVTDMQSGIAKLISASASGSPGNGPSTAPQITSDGRFIVFQSLASDLVQNDNNNASDIFLGDRVLGSVVLLTINSSGTGSANGASSMATLSADGRAVVFQSLASDLIRGDYNDRRDVFVARLSMPDSDADGMDDDFEITYFGDLSHDGTVDSDGDGQTDYQEFLAGTNPTSNASILRAITVGNAGSDAKQVIWSAVPGRSYLVQYKNSLADSWSTLPGTVRATASTAAKADLASVPQRFYRVLLAE